MLKQLNTLSWFVYIVECADGTFYTGASVDVSRRVAQHNAGTGAKYTRARLPVKLVYLEKCGDRSTALQREGAIKKFSRKQKIILVKG